MHKTELLMASNMGVSLLPLPPALLAAMTLQPTPRSNDSLSETRGMVRTDRARPSGDPPLTTLGSLLACLS